ncbi:SMC family ATPase [Sporolactobacillus sp. THM7-4]|nr:SMC family ATPase [Sporolactobacillus sp. THM7-4]
MMRHAKPRRQEVTNMKPIELTIQGLNSFRETQHIDFEKLSADGIFGIFGPTGSGKSTILDAMTLALYGTVERAANNTQGILNQLESQLSVAFSFELSGRITERYRCERTYKRTKDGAVRMSSCRLLKMGEKKEVLADKERDVTRKVEEILGLTHDDFTRAVVLPQGKFSEFLSLRGTERRKMLQRLFHLEKYGDELMAKLKNHSDKARQHLNMIMEKENVLGDASGEALNRLQKEFRDVKSELDDRKKELDKAEKSLEVVKQLRQWMTELAEKRRTYDDLLAQKEAIEEKQLRLQLADAADRILPYLETLIESEQECSEAKTHFQQAEQLFLRAAETEKNKKAEYETAKKAYEENEPLILNQKQQLAQGLTIQRRLKQAITESEKKALMLKELEKQRENGVKRIREVRKDKEDLQKLLDRLEDEIHDLEVSSQFRTIVQQALQQKNTIDTIDAYLIEKRKEWAENHGKWRECHDALERLKEKRIQLEKRSKRFFDQLQTVYHRLIEISETTRLAETYLSRKIERLHHERDEAYRHQLSLDLASNLKDGEPCPVCGAVHHPHPAAKDNSRTSEQIDRMIEAYQAAGQTLLQQQQEIKISLTRVEQQSRQFADIFPDLMNRKDMTKPVAGAVSDANFAEWEKSGFQPVLKKIIVQQKIEKQDVLALADVPGQLSKEAQDLKTSQASIDAQLQFYQVKEQKIRQEAIERKREKEDLINHWPEKFPKLEDVSDSFNQMQENDQQSEKLRKQVREIRDKMSALEKKLADEREHEQTVEAKWNETRGQLAASQKSLENSRDELAAFQLNENSPIEQSLEALNQKHSRLKESRETLYQIWQKKLAGYIKADKLYNNAETRLTRAEAIRNRARETWDKKRADSRFEKREEVLSAHLSAETRRTFNAMIDQYKQKTAELASDIEQLESRLNGRTLTREEAEKEAKRTQDLKTRVQSLTGQVGAKGKELESLSEKHELYKQLESDRVSTQKLADQFEKLQRVFRGNAFVEFIAEEQLQQVCVAASRRLGDLTHGRYALEVDSSGGFIIRDDGNGGIRRPVSSLSGGETFLTSLSLALSLSEQIQLRGNVPLQFFFLDEGFGTLDPDLLDTVITALEKLHMRRLAIGVISHVPEMKERLPRKLIVEPAEPSGHGSLVRMEML